MTKKDYTLLADALAQANPSAWKNEWAEQAWRETVESTANALAADNPRFNAKRFVAAASLIG